MPKRRNAVSHPLPDWLEDWPWGAPGRDMLDSPAPRARFKRLVACVNIWNDVNELRLTLPSWRGYVDHIIAIDGAYRGVPVDKPYSTDGSLDLLREHDAEIVETRTFWMNQAVKRSKYFERAQSGDLLFIVDADEMVYNGASLSRALSLDVGWVRVRSTIYQRTQSQPRLFAYRDGLRYDERHHYVWCRDRLVATHQRGGAGFRHHAVDVALVNRRGITRPTKRQTQGEMQRITQTSRELQVGPKHLAHEPLRVMHVAPFDPGGVIYRLHNAINTSTPHESAFATYDDHPYHYPQQYSIARNAQVVRDLCATADVVHVHVNYTPFERLQPFDWRRHCRRVVVHHHGTELRRDPRAALARDQDAGALVRFCSNFELLKYDATLLYLPNPIPVAHYVALRRRARRRVRYDFEKNTVRVGHSPSKRELKGTDAFLRACKRVAKQVRHKIEPVLIEKTPIDDTLRLKASCDVFFDSFWLGVQCSGLEAGAMGIPTIAGDPDVRAEYVKRYGDVPYEYANDEDALVETLARLITDRDERTRASHRIMQYVEDVHDGAIVAARYLDSLDEELQWRKMLSL